MLVYQTLPIAAKNSRASRSLRSAASALPTEISTIGDRQTMGRCEPCQPVAVENVPPSSLVLVEPGIVTGGEGGDRHQGVADAAGYRLAGREQLPGGRREPIERERPDDRDPEEVAGGLGRLPGTPGGERMAQGFGTPTLRLGDASTLRLEVTDGERGLGQTDVVVQRFERVGRRRASTTADSISASVGER